MTDYGMEWYGTTAAVKRPLLGVSLTLCLEEKEREKKKKGKWTGCSSVLMKK